jgi:hypothetical protein
MEQWYHVSGLLAHCGSGKKEAVGFYLRASNIVAACSKYRYIPGVKRHHFPKQISELTPEELSKVENEMVKRGLPIHEIRRRGVYFPDRPNSFYEKTCASKE